MKPTRDSATGAYLSVGHVLHERYKIVREVGRGGYSVVYHAEDSLLNTDVAVKLLVPPPATAHIARERMRREVRAVRGLSHPHIVAVHDFLEEGPWSFIVMELVQGEDLTTHVARHGVLDPDEVARLGSQIADALSVAHQHGVLHRDVKPQNVLLDTAGNARLVDFGSARLDGLATMTQTGGIVGTIAYTAPEVLAGRRGDARSDVYALGMTMAFGLLGRLPSPTTSTVPFADSPKAYRPKRERPETPAWLDHAISKATASNAAMRFATATGMRDTLLRRDGHFHADSSLEGSNCLICGALDPFDLGLCVECAGSSTDADTLVFLRATSKSDRSALRNSGSALVGGGQSNSQIEEALSGERPLLRVPRLAAEQIVAKLATRSIPSFVVSMSRVGRALPPRFYGLLATVLAVGCAAGLAVNPKFLLASPLVALLLWLLAVRVAQRPLIETPRQRSNLPPSTETRVVQTLTVLPAGAARDLLAELVRLTDRTYKRVASAGYDENVGAAMAELTDSACDVALDIAEYDEQLQALQRGQLTGGDTPTGWLTEVTRSERVRDRLVQRFLEATAVVTRVRNDAFEWDAKSNDLQEATNALRCQLEAGQEVVSLLNETY